MYQKILVPIDGSEAAELGLQEAIALAKNQAAKIRLLHVVNELIMTLPEAYVDFDRVIDALRRNGKTILANGEATVRSAGVQVDTMLVEGMGNAAGDQIIQHAKEWGAELIVCGTHDDGGFGGLSSAATPNTSSVTLPYRFCLFAAARRTNKISHRRSNLI